jgi:hypothetical protein
MLNQNMMIQKTIGKPWNPYLPTKPKIPFQPGIDIDIHIHVHVPPVPRREPKKPMWEREIVRLA